jgi:hypothetical protein
MNPPRPNHLPGLTPGFTPDMPHVDHVSLTYGAYERALD